MLLLPAPSSLMAPMVVWLVLHVARAVWFPGVLAGSCCLGHWFRFCLPSASLRRPRACPPFVSCLGSLPGPAFRGLGFLVSAFRFPGPALFLLVSLPCFRRSFSSSSFPGLASLLAFVSVTRFRAPFLAMCSESPPLSAYGCVPHLDFRVAGDSWLGVPVPDAIFHQSCVCFFSALREVSFLAFEVLPSRIV